MLTPPEVDEEGPQSLSDSMQKERAAAALDEEMDDDQTDTCGKA